MEMVTIDHIKEAMELMKQQSPPSKREYKMYVSKHWYRIALKAAKKKHPSFSFKNNKLYFGAIEVLLT